MYVIACPDCGASEALNLRIQNPRDTVGEIASVVCPAGHEFEHPLVYPEMVYVLITHEHSRIETIEQTLIEIGWQPHARSRTRSADGDLPSDHQVLIEHEPWRVVDDADYRRRSWPQLVSTAEAYHAR